MKCGIARNVRCADIWPVTWKARKLERRDSEDEESMIDLEEKEKPMFHTVLSFAGLQWRNWANYYAMHCNGSGRRTRL